MRLLLTVVDPEGSSLPADVEVTAPAGSPVSCVATQLRAAVGRQDGLLYAGEHPIADEAPLGSPPLLDGAVLTVGQPERRPSRGLLQLLVVAGPDAGAVHDLGPGEHRVGRAAEAAIRVGDPNVSRAHALLRVAAEGAPGTTVVDLSSANGTTVDGVPVGREDVALRPGQVLRVGDTRMVLALPERLPASCRPDGAGHLEVNRPPRHLVEQSPVRVTVPAPPPPREQSRFPILALALPLVTGVALVAATRSPTYLLFVLLAPVTALGSFLGDRVTGRRSSRAAREAYDEAAARAADAVDRAMTGEASARHREHPDLATLLLTVTDPRPRLWERRRHDRDSLELRLGLGDVPAAVEVRRPDESAAPETAGAPTLTDVPVTLQLDAARVVGLAGPRDRLLPVARSVIAQLAGWHSPRHLRLVLLSAERPDDWSWLRWLPHVRSGAGPPTVGLDATQRRARLDELVTWLDSPPPAGPTTVVVLDGARALRRDPAVARLLEEGPAVGVRLVCLEQSIMSLPVECRATVAVSGAAGTRLRIVGPDASAYDGVVPDGASALWAHRFARALAPLRDATPEDRSSALPDSARLLDLVPFDATSADAVESAWRASPRGTRVVLGVGQDGDPLSVDLVRDGPHVLVAGTTGSGKSELLQSLVAGLAAGNRPDELAFVLVDYKGGAAFAECARLPHTVGMVTDLDPHLTERALRSLAAELRRRETVFAAAGCTGLEDYLRDSPGAVRVPRLVLVVDEFASLAEELPEFVGGLVAIAQRGRSLGVHLVLATQRPSGVVSADIRANTSLRIALRVTDPAESLDVVEVPDAAEISRHRPGRAVVRVGSGTVFAVQTARVAGGRTQDSGIAVRLRPWERAGDPPFAAGTDDGAAGRTDLARFVDAAREAASRLGASHATSPWLPPLPRVVTTSDLPGSPADEDAVPLGLVDRPDAQRRDVWTFHLDGRDQLLVAGGPRSGRSTMARTLVVQLAGAFAPTDLHVFALEGAGGLANLVELPHCGAVVGRDETARGDRLVGRLAEEVERRQRLLAADGHASLAEQRRAVPAAQRLPWLVLLVDGWEALTTAYDEVDHGRPLETLLRLVREGAAVGLRVVVTGDRSLLLGRTASLFGERLLLRFADSADYGLAGISPHSVPASMPPGRALLGPDAAEVQLATIARDTTGAGQCRAFDRVVARARARWSASPDRPDLLPLRVEPLPAQVELVDLEAPAKAVASSDSWALLGVGGDENVPVGVDLDRDGPAFVIAGEPGSGRSTTVATMGRWLAGRGRPVLVVAHQRSPLRSLAAEPGVVAVLSPADALALDRLLLERPDVVVLADDAETLHDAPVEQSLLGLLRPDAAHGGGLVLAGTATAMACCFRGLTVEARRARTGLLLGPLAPADGDLLGVRTRRDHGAPAGRGLLVVRGRATPVQVAHTPL